MVFLELLKSTVDAVDSALFLKGEGRKCVFEIGKNVYFPRSVVWLFVVKLMSDTLIFEERREMCLDKEYE